eukprot:TRINITY_DN4237_c0_g1_i3.p1 TRINITY_DN4237_c0_g1~~TRINITY_DN4237_c0_g1_i3.p1  ORF type:complete len:838 (-),score=147.93 TRINITY_DN4237_c0_g1_i3:23-2536(-)
MWSLYSLSLLVYLSLTLGVTGEVFQALPPLPSGLPPGVRPPGNGSGVHPPPGNDSAMWRRFIGTREELEPSRPWLIPSVVGIAIGLFVIIVAALVACYYHYYLTKRAINNVYSKGNRGDEYLDVDLQNLGAASTGMSLSCAFLDYSVEMDRCLKDRFLDIKKKVSPWSPGPKKQILHGISAHFRPGSLTAIMGPSGSGKTTLLNLLSGRTLTGKMSGFRMLDGCNLSDPDYGRIVRENIGYVMQTDMFYKDLSVKDTLLYAALLRLPQELSIDEVLARVEIVMREVALEKIADTLVGDAFIQGISGGQKRRLSIAVELLTLPSLILMDEPTSGLDAHSAGRLISLLSSLSKSNNRTIITTIHSPRPESFNIFNDVLLLGATGSVVYFGPPRDAVEYFSNAGFKSDKYVSPGDYIIDIVGLDPSTTEDATTNLENVSEVAQNKDSDSESSELGSESSESSELGSESSFEGDENDEASRRILPAINVALKERRKRKLKSGESARDSISEDNTRDRYSRLVRLWSESEEKKAIVRKLKKMYREQKEFVPPVKRRITVLNEIGIHFSRRLSRSYWKDTFAMYFQIFCVGFLLAWAFGGQGFTEFNIFYRPYKAIMFIVIVVTYANIVQYLNLVPGYFDERPILRRESENSSTRTSSYLIATFLHETPIALVQVALLTGIGYYLVDLNLDPWLVAFFFLYLSLGVISWQAVVCFCSFATNTIGKVYSFCFVLLGLGSLFGGLPILRKSMQPYFLPFYYTSIPALTYRNLLRQDLSCCGMVLTCNDSATIYGLFNGNDTAPPPPFFDQMNCTYAKDNVMDLGGKLSLRSPVFLSFLFFSPLFF